MKPAAPKAFRSLGVVTAALLASACSTIVFDNGPQVDTTQSPVREKHHIGGFAELVEFSPPKNLAKICAGNNWRSITTEKSFLDGLLGRIVPAGAYAPRTTYTQCSSEGLPVGQTYGTSADLSVTSETVRDTSATASSSSSAAVTGTTPPRYRDDSTTSEPERDYKSNSVGCSEKHRHLFFDCD